MSILYSRKEMNDVLRELKIRAVNNQVNGKEAAAILSWRAQAEHQVQRVYSDQAVRRHVSLGNLVAHPVSKKTTAHPRRNFYNIEDVFAVPLVPARGAKAKEQQLESA